MRSLDRWLTARATPQVVALACLLELLVVLLLAGLPGVQGTLWMLHLAPVGLATWYAGLGAGLAVAIGGPLAATLVPLVVVSQPTGAASGGPERLLHLALAVGFVFLLERVRSAVSGTAEANRYDPSTGLVNSRTLFDLIGGEVDRAQRYGRPFTLAYLTLDNLPVADDGASSESAEEVLRRVAHHLKGSLRTVDVVARLRDREFGVLLPETEAEGARIVINRIRRTLIAAAVEDPQQISFAMGAVTWLYSDLPVEALHQRTYQLMYAARREHAGVHHEVLGGDPVEAGDARQLIALRR